MQYQQLFIDKYKPKNLNDLDYNFPLSQYLKSLAKTNDIPHLLFQGHKGSGKKTRALLFLREKFGDNVFLITNKIIELKYPNKTIDLQLSYSNYHYQINPSIHGVYDRLIIQDFVKDIVKYKTVNNLPYRIIIIEDADKLTYEAQQSLRRTLEKYIGLCRFMFLSNNEGNIIEPLQSRCIKLRVASPTTEDICNIIQEVVSSEKITMSKKSIKSLIEFSDSNLSRTLNYLQLLQCKFPTELADNHKIDFSKITAIESSYQQIIKLLFEGGSLNTLGDLRIVLYNLLVHCIEPLDIIKQIFLHLINKIPDKYFNYQYKIIKATDRYENTLKLGSKPIYHLEGYTIQLFRIIKDLQNHINNSTTSSDNSSKPNKTKKITKKSITKNN